MDPISRRNMLAATAAGGLMTAAGVAHAQSGAPIPQPQRPDMAAPISVRAISCATSKIPI